MRRLIQQGQRRFELRTIETGGHRGIDLCGKCLRLRIELAFAHKPRHAKAHYNKAKRHLRSTPGQSTVTPATMRARTGLAGPFDAVVDQVSMT